MESKNELTLSRISSGADIPLRLDNTTFPGETWHQISLDITTEPGEWDGFRMALPPLPEAKGSAAVSFTLIYKWSAVRADTETAPAQRGYGQAFYVELVAGERVLDACFLAENEPLPECGDALMFYGKKQVTLYAKDLCELEGSALAVNVFIGEPPAYYIGNVWFTPCEVCYISSDELPPEIVTAPMTPPCPLTVPEAVISPADPKLIPEAAAALAYLKGAAEAGRMLYGMQNVLFEKGGNRYCGAAQNTTDIFDLTGTEPSISGFDSLSLIAMEGAYQMPEVDFPSEDTSDPANQPFYIKACALRSLKAWQKGMIPTLSLHMSDPAMVYDQYIKNNKNPVTGRPVYDPAQPYPWNFHGFGYGNSVKTARDPRDGRERSPYKPMLRLYRALTWSGANRSEIGTLEVFNAYLDIVADYCLALQEHGVPVLLRPFHENSGDWFWWGNSGCEDTDHSYNPEIFKRNWRHIVEYMGRRGVHNCLYVYSPNGSDFDNREKQYTGAFRPYAITYPGDAWVDVCGFDDYTTDETVLRGNVAYVANFAAAHGKIAAACEINGSPDNEKTNELIFRALTDTAHLPVNLAYAVQWRPRRFAPYLTSPTRSMSGAANGYIKLLGNGKIVMANETAGFRPGKVVLCPR